MSDKKDIPVLTDKQKRFCEEYLIDLNATKAAIRSGYSKKTAASMGCENLIKPNIQTYIAELKKDVSERNKISVDECVQILADIARFDMAELYDENDNLKSIHNIPKEHRQAIEELTAFEEFQGFGQDRESIGYTKKVKASGKQGAIDKLLKHLGGYEKDNEQREGSSVVIFNLPHNGRD